MPEVTTQVDKPAPEHVIEFIYEEMEALGWDEWELARRMGGDAAHNKLSLEILDACRQVDVLFDEVSAQQIGNAFGTGAEIWINLDKTWREHERVVVERAQLEREVIEAAQYWRRAQGDHLHVTEVDGTRLIVVRAWFRLRKATDALEQFDSQVISETSR